MSFAKKMPNFTSSKKSPIGENKEENNNLNIKEDNNKEDKTHITVDNEEQNNQDNDTADTNNEKQNNEIEELQQQNHELINKNSDLEKKLLYLASEYDNAKKRHIKELENAQKFSISKFADEAVKIFDILITAINNTNADKNDKTFYDGVNMTISGFHSLFEKLNIRKIDPQIGEMFDHNYHEAISQIPSELEIGAIVKTVRCGYSIHERLLRPAMVIVSAGK